METEEFNLEEVVSDATKANADRDFYLAMATQSKAVSPIAAYLAGAAGAKAATLQGKLQANKDAQTAADKFTKRRDDLVLNMHAIARDKNSNPATKAGMIGLIAREIGLQPKDYDAENNILNVSDADGNMMTFDFNEELDEKGKAALEKTSAQIKTEGAKQEKLRAEAEKARSSASGAGKEDYLKPSQAQNMKEFKRFFERRGRKQSIEEALYGISDQAQKTLLKTFYRFSPKDQQLYSDEIKFLEDKFNMRPWQIREPQSTIEESVTVF